MIKQLATKAAAGEFRWARMAYDEAGKLEAKSEALLRKAPEIDERAEEEIQKAVIRELSIEERIEYLNLSERVEQLTELAWTRYEKTTVTRENVRKD